MKGFEKTAAYKKCMLKFEVGALITGISALWWLSGRICEIQTTKAAICCGVAYLYTLYQWYREIRLRDEFAERRKEQIAFAEQMAILRKEGAEYVKI